MEKKRFTAGRVNGFPFPDSGQVLYWDTVVPGFGIRATVSSKVYVFQSRLNGKTIRIKIGDVRSWLLDSNDSDNPGARQEARRLQSLVDKGIDPREAKKEQIQIQEEKRIEDSKKDITLEKIWTDYLEARKHKWSDRHYLDHVRSASKGGKKKKRGKGLTKPGTLAPLMPVKIADLTPRKITSWAKQEAEERGTQTFLAFSMLRALANWCESQNEYDEYKGIFDLDAFSTSLKKDVLPKKKAKKDSLQKEQLAKWFAAVQKYPNQIISSYLQSLLLTGARREELLHLRWYDVDFTWKTMKIRDKVEGERTIPLTPYVASILVGLPQRNRWVFSSPGAKSGRLQEPSKAHMKALEEAGIEGLTIHGLRRSFGTLSEWVETPVGIVYQIQGHRPSATAEKHYRQRPIDLLRKWHTKIEAWILEQAGIEHPELDTEQPDLKLVDSNRR